MHTLCGFRSTVARERHEVAFSDCQDVTAEEPCVVKHKHAARPSHNNLDPSSRTHSRNVIRCNAGEDVVLRTGFIGHPQNISAAASVADAAALDAAASSQMAAVGPATGNAPASPAHEEAVLQAPPIAAEEPAQHTAEDDSAQPSAAAQLVGADSVAAMELEDDVVPELPEYEDDGEDDVDDGEGTEEEVISEHQSEPVSPSRPYGSYSAPVTSAKAGKKGWSFKRMFSSGKKRRKDGGEGIEDDGGNTLPAARSISAGDLSGTLTTPRKKKGGRLARMLGRTRQVRSVMPVQP